jgi:hypothetical protein
VFFHKIRFLKRRNEMFFLFFFQSFMVYFLFLFYLFFCRLFRRQLYWLNSVFGFFFPLFHRFNHVIDGILVVAFSFLQPIVDHFQKFIKPIAIVNVICISIRESEKNSQMSFRLSLPQFQKWQSLRLGAPSPIILTGAVNSTTNASVIDVDFFFIWRASREKKLGERVFITFL